MNKIIKSRKGATLAEIIIVLAVLVIASGMVVSFSSMMHGAQSVSNARHEALRDVRTAEALIEGFIENNADKELVVDSDKLSYTDNGNTYSAYFTNVNGGALVITSPSNTENNPVLFLESIDSITFDSARYGVNNSDIFTSNSAIFVPSINNPENDAEEALLTADTLYYCTITYTVAESATYTYTFCVNPYAGEGGT